MSLSIGQVAPDFEADTTQGRIRFHDWIGDGWAVLFSHPADFTPVCTTELGRTAALQGEFDERNVKVIAVSVDPVESHRNWVPDINDIGSTDLRFPIIADESREVAGLYDMIHPGEGDTSTVRSVFIIDPADKVRLTKQQKKFQDQSRELQTYEEKIHHLADQNIELDLDDGVKVNYAKFGDVLAKIK